jgi:hypothetical protein
MTSLVKHYRLLAACLAIALQGLDAIVGGLGHSHADDVACCTAAADHHHHGGTCSHHHDHATPAEQPADGKFPAGPHDDCSLCRHFSQPVVPVTLTVEVAGCERVETFVPVLVERVIAAILPAHSARGPPAVCA